MFKKFDSEVHALDLNKTRSWINAASETLNCHKRYQSLFNRVKTTTIMGDKPSPTLRLSISRYHRSFVETSHFSEEGVGGGGATCDGVSCLVDVEFTPLCFSRLL